MLLTAAVLGLFASLTLLYADLSVVSPDISFYSKLIQVQNISFDWIFFMYAVWNVTICGVVVVSGFASYKTTQFAIVFLATIMVRGCDFDGADYHI
jgi:glucan phosphoethanolaminetransferase (alkaline phosphatase superfamily)